MLIYFLLPSAAFAQSPCRTGTADINQNFNGFFNSNNGTTLSATVGETVELCLFKTSPDNNSLRTITISNLQQTGGQEELATFTAYTPFGVFMDQTISTDEPFFTFPVLQGNYGVIVTPLNEGTFDVTSTVTVTRGNPNNPIVRTRTRTFTVQIQAGVVAPVTWTKDLTYTSFGENIRFNWSVADQVDVSGYELERMYPNGAFAKVADIAYQENGSLEVDYSVETPWPGQGAYYRVKQLDFAGTYDYSNVVFVEANDGLEQAFGMFPNPATGWVRLSLPTDVKTVELISASGQTIRSLTADEARRGLDVSGVTAGLYLVRPVLSDGPAAPHRLVVNH